MENKIGNEINQEVTKEDDKVPEKTETIEEIKTDEGVENEDESELSEYDQEKLEDFQKEMMRLKESGADPHFQHIEPLLLGPDEHKLYKYFRLYKKEGWPDLRLRIFEKKIRHYTGTILHDLIDDRGHKSKEVKTKDSFQAYLLNKMLVVDAERQISERRAA